MTQEERPTVPVSPGAGDTARVESPASVSPTFPTTPIEGAPAPMGTGQPTVVLGQPPPALAWLAVISGIRAGRLFPLDPRGTVVGRDAQNDIILDDSAVSRQHAKLRREPGARKNTEQFYIYDLGSSNGTFVNDKKVVRKALDDGDRIRIGETLLVFKTAESPPPAKRQPKKRAKRASAKAREPKEEMVE